jgi:DNA helicase-2/ATP-dependent DNA helicase PcrA
VVDWKTGRLPTDDQLPALAVQLAVYRLAWAALAGVAPTEVRAAFHYVAAGQTIAPADLLDERQLAALIDGAVTPPDGARSASAGRRRGGQVAARNAPTGMARFGS